MLLRLLSSARTSLATLSPSAAARSTLASEALVFTSWKRFLSSSSLLNFADEKSRDFFSFSNFMAASLPLFAAQMLPKA